MLVVRKKSKLSAVVLSLSCILELLMELLKTLMPRLYSRPTQIESLGVKPGHQFFFFFLNSLGYSKCSTDWGGTVLLERLEDDTGFDLGFRYVPDLYQSFK